MSTPIDETMSQEAAFTTEDTNDNSFKFDDVEDSDASASQAENTDTKVDTDSASTEDKEIAVDSEKEEQRVPYSRFKKILDERDQTNVVIGQLEERLRQLESNRQEETKPSDVQMPDEWVALYGDSDISKKAFMVQLRREEELQEKAVAMAIDRLKKEQEEDVKRLSDNEKVLDDSLSQLSETLGKKLTEKEEDEILAIVDEFSPVDDQGKYTILFPFEKAFEIYSLRNKAKTKETHKERVSIARLSEGTSEETGDSSSSFERGWDNWRKAL